MSKARNEPDEPMGSKVYPSITPEQLAILGPLIRELAPIAAQQIADEDVIALRAADIPTPTAT